MARRKFQVTPTSSPEDLRTAQLARQHSEERLQAVQQNWPAVKSLASSLRGMRTTDHFAERYSSAHE